MTSFPILVATDVLIAKFRLATSVAILARRHVWVSISVTASDIAALIVWGVITGFPPTKIEPQFSVPKIPTPPETINAPLTTDVEGVEFVIFNVPDITLFTLPIDDVLSVVFTKLLIYNTFIYSF